MAYFGFDQNEASTAQQQTGSHDDRSAFAQQILDVLWLLEVQARGTQGGRGRLHEIASYTGKIQNQYIVKI